MIVMLELTILALVTIFAVAAAAGLHWLLLRAAFFLMRPATARRIPFERAQGKPARTELVRGTTQLARAYSAPR